MSSLPTYDIELMLRDQGYRHVVGVDEVGRGPAAGSVVATAVFIPLESTVDFLGRVKDSKKLSVKKREELYTELVAKCEYGVGSCDNKIIDKVNILNATKMAMKEAISYINTKDFLLIDGNVKLGDIDIPQQQILKGDDLCLSIAAASIIAKVMRDNIMMALHEEYPQYNWIKNKGYLTKEHIQAIEEYGITEYHRKSFKKVGR